MGITKQGRRRMSSAPSDDAVVFTITNYEFAQGNGNSLGVPR